MLNRTLGGDFKVVRRLAAGAMGTVYLAEQASTGKQRALKVLHPQFALDPKQAERFEREARAGSRVKSDHVVEVVAAGTDAETGLPWLAMELLEGKDLAAVVKERGALPAGEVREILRQVCHGLAAAHREGLVHRDLKPENVMLAPSRHVSAPFTAKVLDFGIAKVVAGPAGISSTQPLGTALWTAPEQARERAVITPACDVWSLGLLAFYLLTGRIYWTSVDDEGRSVIELVKEIQVDPIEPASARASRYGLRAKLPQGFDAWFARCVARDPSQRFPDAGAAGEALARVLAAARPGGVAGRVVVFGIAGLAVLMAAIAVALRFAT